MLLRIEAESGEVFYTSGSCTLYGHGKTIERKFEGLTPETFYGIVFDGTYYGIGSESIGVIPISRVVRLNFQAKQDEGMELDSKLTNAMNKRSQKV